MTRPYIHSHRDVMVALRYASRTRETDGAAPEPRFLGGTVPWLGTRRTQAYLEAVPRAAPVETLHIVISLPKGMGLDRLGWTRAMAVTFDGLGLPHRRTPWLAFQHTDAACDHAHIVMLPLTFTGAPIPFDGKKARCEQADIRLCHHLGLTPPNYLQPGMGPRSGILLPLRRQTSKERKTLAQGIGQSLIKCQPGNAAQLASALQRHDIALTEGDRDWWFAHGRTSVAGHQLSPELRPRNLAAIFDHHARLHQLRASLDLRHVLINLDAARNHVQPIFKEFVDDHGRSQRHPDPAYDPSPVEAHLRPAGPDAWGGVGDPGAGPAAGSAPGSAEPAGGSGAGSGARALGDPEGNRGADALDAPGYGGESGAERPDRGEVDGDARPPGGGHEGPGVTAHGHPPQPGGDCRAAGRPARKSNGLIQLRQQVLKAALAAGIAVTTARIRPKDKSVGVTCADGAAVRVTRSRAWLERLGHAGIAPIRRLASALSARLGWPQTTPAWPFPKFPDPGQLLAADKETTQAAVARRLRSARLHWIDGNAANRGRGKDLLQEAMESKGLDAFPDTCTSPPDAFLVLTPACLAGLRQQPRRLAPRLRDLVQEIPKAGVLLVEEEGTVTVLGTVAEVLPRLRVEVTSLSSLQADALPSAEVRQLGPQGFLEQHDAGDEDPEEKGRGIAAPGDEATFLLEEVPGGPEKDGFELG